MPIFRKGGRPYGVSSLVVTCVFMANQGHSLGEIHINLPIRAFIGHTCTYLHVGCYFLSAHCTILYYDHHYNLLLAVFYENRLLMLVRPTSSYLTIKLSQSYAENDEKII